MPATRSDQRSSGSVANRATAAILAVLGLVLVVAVVGGNSSSSDNVSLPPDQRVAVATPLAASDVTGLDLPSVGLHTTDLTTLGLRDDNSLDVPSDASHVGWYDRSASPGAVGPAVMAAHVNYRGEDGAFARLGDMKPGDTVEVHREDRTTAVFTVDRVGQFPKDAFPTYEVYGSTAGPELRLITCGGDFNRRVRSYEDNIVVFAHLTEAYRAA